jgi:hypothetical protein
MVSFVRWRVVTLLDHTPPARQEVVRQYLASITNQRKLGLFSCACGRVVLPLLKDKRSQRALEITEQYLDDLVSRSEWDEARDALVTGRDEINSGSTRAGRTAALVVECAAGLELEGTIRWSAMAATAGSLAPSVIDAAEAHQALLLRDIVGNPFRRP